MLIAKRDEIGRVVGLEFGTDDYVAKPFRSRELITQIKAVLRRARDDNVPIVAAMKLAQETSLASMLSNP